MASNKHTFTKINSPKRAPKEIKADTNAAANDEPSNVPAAGINAALPPTKKYNVGMGRTVGHAGNAINHVATLARQYTVEAIEGLVAIARDPKAPAIARKSAWDSVLDRAWGRAPQKVEIAGEAEAQTQSNIIAIQNVILASLESANVVRNIALGLDVNTPQEPLLVDLPLPNAIIDVTPEAVKSVVDDIADIEAANAEYSEAEDSE